MWNVHTLEIYLKRSALKTPTGTKDFVVSMHFYFFLSTFINSSIFSESGNCPRYRSASTFRVSLLQTILKMKIKTIIHTSRMLTATGYLARSSIIYGERGELRWFVWENPSFHRSNRKSSFAFGSRSLQMSQATFRRSWNFLHGILEFIPGKYIEWMECYFSIIVPCGRVRVK